MDRPVYRAPAEQRTHREQPVYETPETFTHALPYVLLKDTPVPVVPLEAMVPIPVTIVDSPRGPDRVVSFGTTQFLIESGLLTGKEVTISRNDNRVTIKIVNMDAANPVYINSKPGMSATGYPLLAGKEWTTQSTREIYIYNPHASASVQIGVAYDLVTELA